MNAHTLARTLLYNIIKELHKSYKSVQRKEGRQGKECSASKYLKSVNKCTQNTKELETTNILEK